MKYTVKWEIELEANSPKDAAQEAMFSITDGTARCFDVKSENETEFTLVDLDEIDFEINDGSLED